MAEEMKKDTMNQEEEQKNMTPDGNKVETKKHPVKDFFAKNGNKIKGGLAIAVAVGVGVALDKLGLSRLGKKKSGEEAPAETDE